MFLDFFVALACTACGKNLDSLEQVDGIWFCDVYPTMGFSEKIADPRLEYQLIGFRVVVNVEEKTIAVEYYDYGADFNRSVKGGTFSVISNSNNCITIKTDSFEANFTLEDGELCFWHSSEPGYVYFLTREEFSDY